MAAAVALGHRRLKIIDLSEDAAQPTWLPDRSVCVVYNGEIHNYVELAAELRLAGASLRAENDTEVLLWAYRIRGEECFERLNGMWAAAFREPVTLAFELPSRLSRSSDISARTRTRYRCCGLFHLDERPCCIYPRHT
jgi:glutamine phosphoribosylpyrophosphate amidotransferase